MTTDNLIVTQRSKRQKLLADIRKVPLYHGLIVELVDLMVDDARKSYEDHAPASEFLRGNLNALKDLQKALTTQ